MWGEITEAHLEEQRYTVRLSFEKSLKLNFKNCRCAGTAETACYGNAAGTKEAEDENAGRESMKENQQAVFQKNSRESSPTSLNGVSNGNVSYAARTQRFHAENFSGSGPPPLYHKANDSAARPLQERPENHHNRNYYQASGSHGSSYGSAGWSSYPVNYDKSRGANHTSRSKPYYDDTATHAGSLQHGGDACYRVGDAARHGKEAQDTTYYNYDDNINYYKLHEGRAPRV